MVVAADSGLALALGAGIEPDLVVGDMDSLVDISMLERFTPDRIVRFPRDKDETDAEIGLRLMTERGCDEVTIVGGGGGRVDHLIAVALLFERDRPPRRWLTDQADIWLVEDEGIFEGWEDSTVSIFPVGERAAGMHSEGLQWPLDGLEFRRGYYGISNRATGRRVRVTISAGKILVVRLYRED